MDAAALIVAQATRAGAVVSSAAAESLARYVDLLARWNRRINLTALSLDPPDPAAIDRLIVEPLMAARLLEPADRLVVDIGSGGGSPAIPMKIAVPHSRFVLIEAKARKSAFLREALRQLSLVDAEVLTARVEDLAPASADGGADVVTLRAVRLDDAMVEAIRRQLRAGGKLLWFRSGGPEDAAPPRRLVVTAEREVLPGSPSRVVVATLT